MSTLRIRPDNSTVRELNISKETLEVLEKIVHSSQTTDEVKKLMIKKFAKVSPCCTCGGIPSLEVVYDCDGASRVERYCGSCANRVFSRNVSKHNFVRKQHSDRKYIYDQSYHLQRISDNKGNRDIKILVNKCDICNDILEVPDNFEASMKITDEIDDSFESDYDKSTYEFGPKLILCDYCKKEYLLPSYQ